MLKNRCLIWLCVFWTTKPVSDSVLEVSFDGYKHVFLSILFLFVVVNPKQGLLINLFTLRYLTLFFPAKFILT